LEKQAAFEAAEQVTEVTTDGDTPPIETSRDVEKAKEDQEAEEQRCW
jgi:hypothetical protein